MSDSWGKNLFYFCPPPQTRLINKASSTALDEPPKEPPKPKPKKSVGKSIIARYLQVRLQTPESKATNGVKGVLFEGAPKLPKRTRKASTTRPNKCPKRTLRGSAKVTKGSKGLKGRHFGIMVGINGVWTFIGLVCWWWWWWW